VPLYEYECLACGKQFELLVRASTSDAPACPVCRSHQLERVLSEFAVSSETTRESAIQSARRKLATNRDRRDRLHAQNEDRLEHLREDYGVEPDKRKS
jgi:putative FmdB family regulatory protein